MRAIMHIHLMHLHSPHSNMLRCYALVSQDGKMMFSLEANNLVDEEGNSKQTQMPYFENGWVEEVDESKPKSGGGFKLPWQK